MDDTSVKIDASKLEEEFSIKKIAVPSSYNSNKKDDKPIAISTLTGSRQQNINLVLAKTKLNPQTICEALKAFDTKKLSIPICEMLLPILPPESELTGVKEFADPNLLADPDKFIFALGDIPGFDLRIKSILFKANYIKSAEELDEKLKCVLNTVNFFRNDGRVIDWLKIVLAYGNYLNGTSNRY